MYGQNSRSAVTPPQAAAEATGLPQIMMISDSSERVKFIQELLTPGTAGSFLTARSVAETIDRLGVDAGSTPSLQTDLFLVEDPASGMNGIDACLRLKAVPHLHDIPIILMTSNRQEGRVKEAFDAGAADVMTQPLSTSELLARVRSVLKRKRELDMHLKREQELTQLSDKLSDINHTLSRLSSTDVLTGIANRGRFDEYLFQEWKCAIRESTGISLVLLDLDYFTAFNNSLGREQGDECLKLVAGALEQTLKRPGDCLARFGGGVFAAVLPQAESRGTAMIADLLRLAVSALEITHPQSPLSRSATVTVGAATAHPRKGDSPLSLLVAAEQALYQAKKEGRNCVRHRTVDLVPPPSRSPLGQPKP